MSGEASASRVDWKAVGLYYALACAISWPSFWWRDMHTASWAAWRVPGFLKMAPIMWGPGIAALVALAVFRRSHPKTITFFGSSAGRSLAFYFVPFALLAAVCLPGAESPGRVAGMTAALSVIGFFNILGEELGWRGFLQDALRPLARLPRYVLLGAMWEFWHFTNRTHEGGLAQVALCLAIWYPVTMLLSALIGEAADRSRALVVAVTLHSWIDALFEAPSLLGVAPWRVYAVFAVSLVFWAWMLWRWRGRRAEVGESASL
jgi:membrane protease YdiL (CAAX protease family)